MEKVIFWKKISNYAFFMMLIILIIKMFFKKYYDVTGMYITTVIGVVSVMIWVLSEIMQYKHKKK